MIRARVSVKRVILINEKNISLKCFGCLEFKFYVMQGCWLRTLIYNTTKMKEAPWQQEVNSGFIPKQLRAIFTSIFLIRKNAHNVQNIIRITNKKEKKEDWKTLQKGKDLYMNQQFRFCMEFNEASIGDLKRWQKTSIFFISTTTVSKESTWRSEPSGLRKCVNITAGKVIIFSPQIFRYS